MLFTWSITISFARFDNLMYPSTNTPCLLFWRKLADKLAATGFFVVVPDFFYGDPFVLGEEGFAALPGWIKHHEPVGSLIM